MEALADILHALRVTTSIISLGRFRAPWSVSTRGAPGCIFHAVICGDAWVRLDRSRDRAQVHEGDVALVCHGEPHVTCSSLSLPPHPISALVPQPLGGAVRFEHGGDGAPTHIICGSFQLDHLAAPRLLDLLPPLIVIPGRAERTRWLESTLQLVATELERGQPGSEVVLSRLAEVLVIQLLRTYFLSLPAERAGWMAALRDEQIGRALALIHAEPGSTWSADKLASRVGMSRASFFARFCQLVGEPPVRYLTRWRIRAAADLLGRDPALSVSRIAQQVGYRSEEAFTRAFRRELGLTPRAFRTTPRHDVLPS